MCCLRTCIFHFVFPLYLHTYVLTYVCAEAESSLSGLASDASSVVVRSTLDQVTKRSQQLQKDLADSAHLLSKYNLKSAQQVSTEAQSDQDCGTAICALCPYLGISIKVDVIRQWHSVVGMVNGTEHFSGGSQCNGA